MEVTDAEPKTTPESESQYAVTVLNGAAVPAAPVTVTAVPIGPIATSSVGGALITALAIGIAAVKADIVSSVIIRVVYNFLLICIFSFSPFLLMKRS